MSVKRISLPSAIAWPDCASRHCCEWKPRDLLLPLWVVDLNSAVRKEAPYSNISLCLPPSSLKVAHMASTSAVPYNLGGFGSESRRHARSPHLNLSSVAHDANGAFADGKRVTMGDWVDKRDAYPPGLNTSPNQSPTSTQNLHSYDAMKARPRGESDLGRPAPKLQTFANGYALAGVTEKSGHTM